MPQADQYGNYGDLEGAARDFVRKFGVTAGDDLENVTNVLGEGANKLQGRFFLLASSSSWFTGFVLLWSWDSLTREYDCRSNKELSEWLNITGWPVILPERRYYIPNR